MTNLLRDKSTVVRQLRVRAAGLDPLAARLRAASLLNTLTLQPAGLGPSAIVCVRRLRDPRPGSLRLEPGDIRAPDVWERAVHAALGELLRSAARPALGAVPASAEAVLFADRAELLACLVSDWFAGCAGGRWWWQGLFRRTDLAATVLPLLREAPAYLPATLRQLADRGLAVPLVRSLKVEAARVLFQDVAQTFALIDLVPSLDPVPDDSEEVHLIIRSIMRPGSAAIPTEMPAASRASPEAAPWRPFVPEAAAAELRPEQQALLGVCLLLYRAPAVARAPAFAPAVYRWWRSATKQEAGSGLTSSVDAAAGHSRRSASPGRETSTRLRPPPPPVLAGRSELPLASGTPPAVAPQPPFASQPAPAPVPSAPEPASLGPAIDRWPIDPSFPGPVPPTKASPVRPTPLETELGGLFYLINLGLFLDLYGDFTTPARLGIALSLWDFVTLLGERLLDTRGKADPMWGLLAELAGRDEGEPPGKDFEPPDVWRVPTGWLTPFSQTGSLRWEVEDRRLRAWHAEGFAVLDVPLAGSAPDAGPGRLARWLDLLMPYVRARLRKALGVIDEDDLGRILCKQTARVFVTATHLDVVFALAELPIAIRLAGLDRDPGWVPAAGRFVRFHYT